MSNVSPPHPSDPARPPLGAPLASQPDLDRIAEDLAGVEVALDRLDAGTYWTCEATGQPLPDDLLAADPVTRRLHPSPPEPERTTA
jgi:RNA polymerase-binding transcription factor DksA